eukprot:scaffold21597_cov108-Isochrysis_galbana.AAC.6
MSCACAVRRATRAHAVLAVALKAIKAYAMPSSLGLLACDESATIPSILFSKKTVAVAAATWLLLVVFALTWRAHRWVAPLNNSRPPMAARCQALPGTYISGTQQQSINVQARQPGHPARAAVSAPNPDPLTVNLRAAKRLRHRPNLTLP